jgi:hypothetical protein
MYTYLLNASDLRRDVMKRRLFAVAATLLVALTLAMPAFAVMFGAPDGNNHPYVGIMVAYDENWVPQWRCSGTIISPTVFLTAGHCVFGASHARVWFDAKITPATGYPYSGGSTGTPIPHPSYNDFATFPATHDVGVVILDQRVKASKYGVVAQLGELDRLQNRRGLQNYTFDIVGYGLQGVLPDYQADKERYAGDVKLNNLGSAYTDGYNIQVSSNPGNNSGGLCFGDSGGPVFLDGTNVVVAVNSFVLNNYCRGNGYSYRTDISDTQDFLANYLK